MCALVPLPRRMSTHLGHPANDPRIGERASYTCPDCGRTPVYTFRPDSPGSPFGQAGNWCDTCETFVLDPKRLEQILRLLDTVEPG
jgi:hypothetical protein